MGEYMQFSAKTKNEAITKACIELGVSSDQLDIQVVKEAPDFLESEANRRSLKLAKRKKVLKKKKSKRS